MTHEHLYACDRAGCREAVRSDRGGHAGKGDWLTVWTRNRDLHFCGMPCLVKWATDETHYAA